MSKTIRRPLEGVRVLTIEHFGAGPYATQLMSELGAEVIKCEAPSTGGAADDVVPVAGPVTSPPVAGGCRACAGWPARPRRA